MPPESKNGPVVSRRGLRLAGLAAAGIVALVVVFGLSNRKNAEARLSKWTEAQAVPAVSVVKPDTRGRSDSIDLPGRLEAHAQAQIFARVSGYLKSWSADIGAPVKAGQVLAEIDAPDLDQQIMQAKANLAAAQANADLATGTLVRGQSLITTGAISKQVLDQRIADASNKVGLVNSAQAELERLRSLENYKRIVAPFDGIVTARSTDVGALINAGGSGGSALFVVSDVSRLRVYVNVPQAFVPSIRVGTKAAVSVPEYAGRKFPATVEATSQSVDPASGTMRMQLVVDNAERALVTGAYAFVRLELAYPNQAINIPSSALIFDQSGLRVATVGNDDRIALKTITISRDLGKVVEIATGLTPEDRVVETPPDGSAQGDPVRVVNAQANGLKMSQDVGGKSVK